MQWISERQGRLYRFADETYECTVKRLSARECRECGYPQCRLGYWMKFTRGAFLACSFHDTAKSAIGNANRIMGYLNGTCDVFGIPLEKQKFN